MAVRINNQVETLIDILPKKFGAKKFFIFGSHAYGNPDPGSDLALCLIVDFTRKRKIEIIREIRRAMINLIASPMDILVYYEKEFEERSQLPNTLEHKIMTEGILVYEQ